MVDGQGIQKIKSLLILAPVTTLLASNNPTDRPSARLSRRSLVVPLKRNQVSHSTQTEPKHANCRQVIAQTEKKFGETPPSSKLPREIWKWLQNMSLRKNIKNVIRDFSNGYAFAEILGHYYPEVVSIEQYRDGDSFPSKQANWHQLEISFKKIFGKKQARNSRLPEMTEMTIHEKPGAPQQLIFYLYETLTAKKVNWMPGEYPENYTDDKYQALLPLHARHTASTAIKTNLKITEEKTDPNINSEREKTHKILDRHRNWKSGEKESFPDRFEKRPTLCELAERVKLPPSQNRKEK